MIDINTSMHAPIAPLPKVKATQESIVNKNETQYTDKELLSANQAGYKGIIINKNKDVIVQIGGVDLKDYSQEAKVAVNDIRSRAGVKGQFLNWIGVLPENQLKNIDKIYDMADEAKKGGFTDLAVLGIGGSRHTTEAMMKMLGKDSKVHFYSGIDPESFKRFANGLDLDKTKFLVVSKSGGTLETTIAYENARKLLEEKYPNQDLSERLSL